MDKPSHVTRVIAASEQVSAPDSRPANAAESESRWAELPPGLRYQSAPWERPGADNGGITARENAAVAQLSGGKVNLHALGASLQRVPVSDARLQSIGARSLAQGTRAWFSDSADRGHELWHLAQQAMGRVTATATVNGQPLNNDPALEREADRMGAAITHSHADPAALPMSAPASGSVAARPVMQAKVGFEFETGIKVATSDWFAYNPLDYQQLIFTPNSGLWKIVADSSNMEFVTEPFTENLAGRARLQTAMTEIMDWAAKIPAVVNTATANGQVGDGRVDAVDPAVGTTANTGILSTHPIVIRLRALNDAQIIAAPQATGGIRLEHVPQLIRRMTELQIHEPGLQPKALAYQTLAGWSSRSIKRDVRANTITPAEGARRASLRRLLRRYQRNTGVSPQNFGTSLVGMQIEDAFWLAEARGRAIAAVNKYRRTLPLPRPNLDKLKGLLTLVISYLLVGARSTQVMEYSKLIAPLMARTNFHALFQLLSPTEQGAFTENFILRAAGLPGTGATHLYVAGFQGGNGIDHGPTRGAWIDSIRNGSPGAVFGTRWRHSMDLLSQGSGSTAADNSSSLGSMQQPDTRVTGQQDLAVLELRRLPQGVQRRNWRRMAMSIFDMIVALG